MKLSVAEFRAWENKCITLLDSIYISNNITMDNLRPVSSFLGKRGNPDWVARYDFFISSAQPKGSKMPRATINDGLDKFKRYRMSRKTKGMKLLRIWVPDPSAPGFAEEARRQAELLRSASEEAEVLAFIEAVADTEGWKA